MVKINKEFQKDAQIEPNKEQTSFQPITDSKKEDDVLIDFSQLSMKAKNLLKKKEEKKKGETISESAETPKEKKEETKFRETSEEDSSIDFSELKEKTKTFFKSLKGRKKGKGEGDGDKNREGNEYAVDFNKIKKFSADNAKWLVPLILLLIAIFTSTYFRMLPLSMPISDNWAENTVYNFYQSQIENQIAQQYPNLPAQNRQSLVNKEFQKLLEENKEMVRENINQLSQQYKMQFKDENGELYLNDIDTYLWYSESRNVVNYGHLGDEMIDGVSYFSLRDGRPGKQTSMQLHPYICAYLYKFLSFFNPDISLKYILLIISPIIIGLSLIPAFFIGRKIAGNVGGFFAAMFLAINAPLLSRTPAGFADTDAYSVLLPLFIAWFVLEAYTAKKDILRYLLAAAAGFLVSLYSIVWPPGWSSIFLIILAVIAVAFAIKMAIEFAKNRQLKRVIKEQKNYIYKNVSLFITFLISSGIFVSLLLNFRAFQSGFTRWIPFIILKEVGIKTIWPNVLTTVAEFNVTSFSNLINQAGGKLLVVLAVAGILIALIKKKKDEPREFLYFVLLSVWLASTAYAFTKGTRFAVLMAAPFALGLGFTLGFIYEKCSSWLTKGIKLNKEISKILVFVLIALLLISPFSMAEKIAVNEVPSMNDGWYNALTKIKNDSGNGSDSYGNSIITSWWDFGHWFVAIAQQKVTFDGGSQGERIHWVGKVLRTDNEAEAIGILRMLNCVQEEAPHKLDEFTGNSLKSIQILYKIFPISDRNEAKKKYMELGLTKEQAEIMLDFTHCKDLLTNYFITSEDMVGKSGVWGHFGSWDFEKAIMYQNTNKMIKADAIKYLTENFSLTEEEADQTYYEIQTTEGDHWISPWPGYLSGMNGCDRESEDKLRCAGSLRGAGNFAFQVDLKTYDVIIENNKEILPNSIVYATKEKIEEKKFTTGQNAGFSIILIPDGNEYRFVLADPLQAASTFTKLFFLEGHGMKCFSKFDDVREATGGRIIVWKVNYDCKQENKAFFQKVKDENQETMETENMEEGNISEEPLA